jgi:hypothetical protein
VLAGDISTRQHCASTTMLAGDSYMCQQSIFHVSAQIVFGLVLTTEYCRCVDSQFSVVLCLPSNQQPAGEGKAHPNIAFAVSYRTQEQANQTMENYFE